MRTDCRSFLEPHKKILVCLFYLPTKQEVFADTDYSLSLAESFYNHDKNRNIFQVSILVFLLNFTERKISLYNT